MDLPLRFAALLLGCLSAAGCGDASSLRLEVGVAEESGGGAVLELSVTSATDERVLVFAGTPWEGSEPFVPDMGGLLISTRDSRPVAKQRVRGEVPWSTRLSAAECADLPSPVALQAAVAAPGQPPRILATSAPVVAVRGPGGWEVGTFGQHVWGGLAGRAAIVLLLPAVLIAILAIVRWPRLATGSRGLALVLVMLLAVLAGRVLRSGAERADVDLSYAPAALFDGDDWDLGGDHLERALGPGFRQLVEAAAAERRGDEPLVVWGRPRGESFIRSVHLAEQTRGEFRRWSRKRSAPRGLVLMVGVPAQGQVLAETEVGVLARIDGASR